MSNFKVTVDDSQREVKQALSKVNKLKTKKPIQWDMNSIAMTIKREPLDDTEAMDEDPLKSAITLNATAEFCRTLGDIPTYGMAGNRDEDEDELMVRTKICLLFEQTNFKKILLTLFFPVWMTRTLSGNWQRSAVEIKRKKRKSEKLNVFKSAAVGMCWKETINRDPTTVWTSIVTTKVFKPIDGRWSDGDC